LNTVVSDALRLLRSGARMSAKTRDKGCRSEIAAAIHEMMSDAHDAGVVSGATLRTCDAA